MDGRWTIHRRGWGHLVTPSDPADVEPGSWPVVPCDDAAVERAAKVLFLDNSNDVHRLTWNAIRDIDRDFWLKRARVALRAAGETP